MFKIEGGIKNNFILLLVCLSIFFSYTEISLGKIYTFFFDYTCIVNGEYCDNYLNYKSIPLRFSYILALPFLIYDKIYLNKKLIILSLILILFSIFLSLISFTNFHDIAINSKIFEDLHNKQIISSYFLQKKKIFEFGIIFYLILFIYNYCDLIKHNVFKIINIFLILFFISITTYFLKAPSEILLLTACTRGFFAISKFIYIENSHLHLIAIPVICYAVLNIKKYFNNFYILFFLVFFIIFTLLNVTTTYFLGIVASSIFLIIINKKFFSYQNLILLMLLVLNIIFLFNTKTCRSEEDKLYPTNSLEYWEARPKDEIIEHARKNFKGNFQSPKDKLFSSGLGKLFSKSKDKIEFSPKVVTDKDKYDGSNAVNYEIYLDDAVCHASKKAFEDCEEFVLDKEANKSLKLEEHRLGLSFSVPVYAYLNALVTLNQYPLGTGLNNYELTHKLSFQKYLKNRKIYYAPIYDHLALNILNYNGKDGGLNIPKLIAEFGVFSFIIFISLIYLAFSSKMSLHEKSFFLVLLMTQLLFRGTGYYNNGFLIVLIIALTTVFKKNEN